MVILQKPGEMPQKAGEYIECDSKGNIIPGALPINMKLGVEPLPPTHEEGRMWKYLGSFGELGSLLDQQIGQRLKGNQK